MEYYKLIPLVLVLVAFCSVSAHAVLIANPSFELEHDGLMPNGNATTGTETWGMPDDWSWRKTGHMNGHGIRNDDTWGWSSDGDWSLYIFSAIGGSHSTGDYIEFYQSVDMTGMSDLLFDVYLRGGTYTNSYVAVDSQKLWIRNEAGTLYDVALDISSFSGVHEIQLGVEVFEPFGNSADGWTYFDNLRLVPEPTVVWMIALGGLFLLRRKRAV
jgi:hypothetical protein